jgi:hypothetical protein
MKQRKNWAGLYINWSNIPTAGGSTPIWAEPLISIFRNTRKTDFMFRAEYLRSEEKIVQARSVVHVAPDIRPGHAPCHFPQIQYRVCSQKREREQGCCPYHDNRCCSLNFLIGKSISKEYYYRIHFLHVGVWRTIKLTISMYSNRSTDWHRWVSVVLCIDVVSLDT